MFLFLALLGQVASAPVAQGPTPFTNKEESRIVCKTVLGTGSRLNSQRLCMPKREWQRMWDNSKEAMGSLQDNHSTKPMDPH